MKRAIYIFELFIILTTLFSNNDDIGALNNEAPNVAFYNLDGVRLILYAMLNKLANDNVVIINFTSIYCRPCKKEIPELVDIVKRSKGSRLMFVFNETPQAVSPEAARFGIYDISYSDTLGSIQMKFGVKRYPVTFVISKKRRILGRFEGYSKKNIEAIIRLVLP
ncbi:MAG: TlpA family protein disulfide reductase [Spirochaetes bacterium]|nr:TlpA family protein disulfide reductase [Spirochaetota bacterium]